MRPTIPAEILAMGHARSAARRSHDFHEADRLRAAIEEAGYRVVDRGRDFRVWPAHPADVVEDDGRVRYGWSGAVPSRLDEPATARVSLVIVAEDGIERLRRTLAGLREHAPAGTHVILVTPPHGALDDALTPDDLLAPVAGAVPEVVRTAQSLRPAAARNAGARRATGAIVAWLQAGAVPTGDCVSPLVDALADPTVAVAGAVGLVGSDIRHLAPGPAGDVVAIDRTLLAFRRDDLVALGALDERFHGDDQLDRWWSLVLRDGPDDPDVPDATDMADALPEPAIDDPAAGAPGLPEDAPGRALALDLPLDPSGAVALTSGLMDAPEVDEREAARRRKRDLYRLIDRFIGRPDLLDGSDHPA